MFVFVIARSLLCLIMLMCFVLLFLAISCWFCCVFLRVYSQLFIERVVVFVFLFYVSCLCFVL